MPPIPFPFPINVGTDICSVQRIFHAFAQRSQVRSTRFVDRILTHKELKSNNGKAIATYVQQWWALQHQRQQLAYGHKYYPSNPAAHGERSRTGPFIDGYRPPIPHVLKDLGMKRSEINEAVDSGALPEESVDGTAEAAAGQENIDADDPKLAGAAPIHAAVASTAGKTPGIEAQDTGSGRSANATKQNREGADVETISATEVNIGEEATVEIISKKQQKNARAQKLGPIDIEIDRLYSNMWDIAQFLAGRFAAKEAIMKAYETRRLTYHDIRILRPETVAGRSKKPIAMVVPEDGDWSNAQIVPLSISHDGGFATAVCLSYEARSGAAFETADDVTSALSKS